MRIHPLRPLLALCLVLCLSLCGAAGARAQGHDGHDVASGPATGRTAPDGRTAPLFDGMGDHSFAVTTASAEAQRFFDQGLVLAYGYNHAEAERSFREAARLDPSAAMPYWGVAYVLGPNLNAGMEDANVPKAYEAIRQALDRAAGASEKEQALIHALAARYAPAPTADRAALDSAYAAAMAGVVARFPDDAEAATLYGDALMNTMPWNYWQEDGEPRDATRKVLATLDRALEIDPDHPGALHFYIHAVEAVRPEMGVAAADRLNGLVPGAGHLVHMPGHIYLRVGRYHDAVVANEMATAADNAYVTQCHAQGMYPLLYVPHNHHFLWAAAIMEGSSAKSIEAARHMAATADTVVMRQPGFEAVQHYALSPLFVSVRFGQWDAVLAAPQPADDLPYMTAVWHYARGTAFARTGDVDAATQELRRFGRFVNDPMLADRKIWGLNKLTDVVRIARESLAGEVAAAKGDYDRAVGHLEKAVAVEDGMIYDEPSPWAMPARHTLGAVLLEAGRPADAEQVYRTDLEKHPENGWSLFGLAESLRAQGRTAEAEAIAGRLAKAWAHADVTLTASRF